MAGDFISNDLSAMLSIDDFATVVLRAIGTTFTAIFDVPYRAINTNTGEMESLEPSILARTSDVTLDTIGEQITIDAFNYRIMGKEPMEPDGALTRVILRRAT